MKSYIISDGNDIQAEILPEKGATVVSIIRDGIEFLYRNPENLASSERPRCGIPFLFPIFGRLKDGQYVWEGKPYAMEIHGFGHTSAWEVMEYTTDTLRLILKSNENTLSMYPFQFQVELCFKAERDALAIYQRYKNLDVKPMPYSFGFHPYFRVDMLEHAQVEITAASRWDNKMGKAVPFGSGTIGISIPEGSLETGSAFTEVKAPTVLNIPAEGRRITLEYDAHFPRTVLWTQAGKPFLCVESINGTANGFNTGTYFTLAPGEIEEASLYIHVNAV